MFSGQGNSQCHHNKDMIVQLIQASWDVAVDDQEHPTIVQVSLKSSQTDPFRRGVHIGSTQDDLCPVATLLAYFAVRGGGGGGGATLSTISSHEWFTPASPGVCV